MKNLYAIEFSMPVSAGGKGRLYRTRLKDLIYTQRDDEQNGS